jgi:hypothetical protein
MNSDVKQAVRDKLGAAQDNLHRARAAFRGCDAKAMAEQHGESGETRAAVLAGYESEVQRWEKALESVR